MSYTRFSSSLAGKARAQFGDRQSYSTGLPFVKHLLQNLLFRSRTPEALPSRRIKLQGGEGWPARPIFSSRSNGPASGARETIDE